MTGKSAALVGATLLIGLSQAMTGSAQAQAVDFSGKTFTIGYGGGTAGGMTYAQVLAPFIGRHLPGNPRVITTNLPGAGTLVAATYVAEVAPADGTFMSVFSGNITTSKLFRTPGVRFDPATLAWIGSMTSEVTVTAAWHASGVTDIQEIKKRKFIVGGGAAASGNVIYPTLMNRMFGMQFHIIRGFASSAEVILAAERGEVDGVASWAYTSIRAQHAAKVRDGQIAILLQLSLNKHRDLPNVPLITDLAASDEDRAILELICAPQDVGRPFAASPKTPRHIVTALRRAFDATLADQAFLREAEKLTIEINRPMTGEHIDTLIARLHSQPEALVEKAIKLIDTSDR
jgi:tripartite-type tricarboxylate transporter receptor subunit TctC